ncbi:LPS export ABC transporter ATP-binding protein [Puniceicoccus vermicola]|uniref:LPS export ABC transporter ATP-binding protein n=1 Tax=Puniceicoccus vermicola TaxID=388746 RepID=A0A7X1AVY7_9BACT|nr:LPS export ABC transporter ATP-binding protein [Puniceicoccus vermicola]MBC2600842.1 LPS export ABC transporter ATP-binding protein [Puniceicoccus vermicola]
MNESPSIPSIRTEGLTRDFGKRRVVNDVALSVNAGEIVGLLGPNGAGKTTTFYMIVGLIEPTRGRIHLREQNVTKLPMYRRARQGIGYLPQEASVFRKMTVRNNIISVLETLKIPRKEREESADEKLAQFGLEKIAHQKAYTLSGGERRRVEIARALATRPDFLLMDEPFSGVDPISVDDVQSIIRDLKKIGIGILITDHNVRETLEITDRSYLLYEGKVLCEGDRDTLLNDPSARKFYLGEGFKA